MLACTKAGSYGARALGSRASGRVIRVDKGAYHRAASEIRSRFGAGAGSCRLFEQGRRAGSLYHAQRQHLEARLQVIEQELMRLQEASPELAAEQNRLLERHLLTIQKNRYREASHTGLISSATADSLLKRLNQTMRDLNS